MEAVEVSFYTVGAEGIEKCARVKRGRIKPSVSRINTMLNIFLMFGH